MKLNYNKYGNDVYLKGRFTQKGEILSFTHLDVVPNLNEFLISYVEEKYIIKRLLVAGGLLVAIDFPRIVFHVL